MVTLSEIYYGRVFISIKILSENNSTLEQNMNLTGLGECQNQSMTLLVLKHDFVLK